MHRYFLVLLLTSLFALSAQAQTKTGGFINVQYLYVDAENLETFLTEVNREWNSVQNNLESGFDMNERRLYRTVYSSNKTHRYNFVAVEIASGLSSIQPDYRPNSEKLLEYIQQYPAEKFIIHSEIWNSNALVFGDEAEKPARYKNVNFMHSDPANLNEYLNLETEIAKPLHQNQVDNERMLGWNFFRLVFPTGTSVKYNFITADYYSSLEQIELGITRDIISRVHPDMDVDEFEDFADAIRERVWSDLWELVEFVE